MRRKEGGVSALAPGDAAPGFVLPDDAGGLAALEDYRGSKLVLYFYPKDDTSGCTLEAQDFDRLAPDFAKAGARVLGVSADGPASHAKFKGKHGLSLRLASDEGKETLSAYGVWVEKNMYGRAYMGVERSTFLIGADGRIAAIWRKVKTKGHAEAALAAARDLP
ncbi:peroxiredoxin [Methylocella sp.]|uniref:peroxiredoxin n=1 Tax=Methylocella sp. TaxID=1978226 RepID=UPI0035AE3698